MCIRGEVAQRQINTSAASDSDVDSSRLGGSDGQHSTCSVFMGREHSRARIGVAASGDISLSTDNTNVNACNELNRKRWYQITMSQTTIQYIEYSAVAGG